MLKVDIKNISRTDQDNKIIVLRDIHFTIDPGKVYLILGKNGSGKSTLIKSLTNLLNKNIFDIDGSVIWNDENILTVNEDKLILIRKNEIRYVLQDLTNNFDPLKNIKYYFDISGLSEEPISKQLKELLLPDYKTISQLYPYEISGGMAQRLSFLFAILPKPKLIILDEPTSAIDYTNINLIKLKLDEHISLGNSALIVTQDIQFAERISDEIAFLANQTLTEFRTKESFFTAPDPSYLKFIKTYNELK
ncbi:MAG: ATP-binding cassette domain-containing protein [Ignavibacteriales bacterium]|nr:ATP-binding cassette domain-containing protein [Ignavibacteriales bacterium]